MITGINCSCVMYESAPYVHSSMCVKHQKDIFGRDSPDYIRFRTDEDRDI